MNALSLPQGADLHGEGFTLVEVMVALSILSLVLLATVTGLRTLANTQTTLERVTSRVDEVRSVSGFIRDSFESAVLTSGRSRLSLGGRTTDSSYFEITRTSVAWKSTVLLGESYGGSYLVRVAREGNDLVLRWQEPNRRGLPGDWGEANARSLVTAVEEFKVSYRENFRSKWTDRYERNVKPDFVRMQIKAGGRYWPDLIFRVNKSS